MENMENVTEQQAEQQTEKAEPIRVIEYKDVEHFFKQQAQDFELEAMLYQEGKKDKFTLYGKIASVMGDLDRIPKTGYNKAHDYYYVTESDVVGSVRPLMAKNKLVMIPSIKTYKCEQVPTKYSTLNLGTIEIRWTVIDGESAEQVSFTMIGKGTDTLEKDIYKSISGNKKYALISLFMIDSGDDPERNDTPNEKMEKSDGGKKPQGGQNQSKPNPGTKTPAGNKNPNSKPQGSQNQSKTGPVDQKEPNAVKQPTKGDLITRWIVLAGDEKTTQENRADFDTWYKKKTAENWDHMAMMTALTTKLKEKQAKGKADEKNEGGETKDPGKEAENTSPGKTESKEAEKDVKSGETEEKK